MAKTSSYRVTRSTIKGKQTDRKRVGYPAPPCYVCHVKTGRHANFGKLGRKKSVHHLIPQSLHARIVATGRYALNDCRSRTVLLCRMCHDAAHRLFTNQTMADHLSTPSEFRSAVVAAGWLEYVEIEALKFSDAVQPSLSVEAESALRTWQATQDNS